MMELESMNKSVPLSERKHKQTKYNITSDFYKIEEPDGKKNSQNLTQSTSQIDTIKKYI